MTKSIELKRKSWFTFEFMSHCGNNITWKSNWQIILINVTDSFLWNENHWAKTNDSDPIFLL